jgi:ABC-type sugar transport system ATPase subunit
VTSGENVNTAQAAKPASLPLPLFYLDQNQGLATAYEVTHEQATAMKAAGRGKFINRGKAFQLCEPAPLRQNFVCSASTDSTASISVNEIEANVGITSNNGSPNEPALRHVVKRAQQKIKAIGRHLEGTFDSKAPLAFGAWSWPVYRSGATAQLEG